MKVRHAMTKMVVSIGPSALVEDALDLMIRHNISGLPVIDAQRRPVGVITEYDILKLYRSSSTHHSLATCASYMSTDLVTIQDHESLGEAADLLLTTAVRRLLVVAGDQLVGLLARRDVARWIRDERLVSLGWSAGDI